MVALPAIGFGVLVGLALGLTGSGGSTLAIPLLVFGLSVDAAEAVAISLLAVGAAAIAGFAHRLRQHEADLGTGAALAVGGVATAPIGAWIGGLMPDALLLGLFGILVLIVSIRMWRLALRTGTLPSGPCAVRARISWRCVMALSGAGVTTGLLSGMFGVGGGFVVVPAVVFATGASMHRAVATSLMVVSIVSMSALASMLVAGREMSWATALPFLAGSIAGVAAGTWLARRIGGPRLQQGFALALGLMGVLVVVRSLAR